MSVRATVGQVAMVGGDRHEQPSSILVDERGSQLARGRRRGNLYALVEVSGPASGRDLIAPQLLEIVRDVYYSWRGSVTHGLEQAIRAANDELWRVNQSSLPGDRVTAGISCVVLRDDDLFVAQAGPAAVFLACGGEAERFPEVSTWLDNVAEDETEAVSLGVRQAVTPDLFHAQIGSGDLILLVDTPVARRLPWQTWAIVLARSTVDAVLGTLLAAGKGGDLTALAVRLDDEDGAAVVVQAPRTRGAQQISGVEPDSMWDRLVKWWSDMRLGERLEPLGQALMALLGRLVPALLTLVKRMMPGQSDQQAATRGRTKVTPKRTDARTSRTTDTGRQTQSPLVQRLLFWVAIAIPVIVAVIVLVLFYQRGRAQRVELETIMQNAEASWALAGEATDQPAKRTHLSAALGFVDELLELQPDQAEVVDLRQRIVAQLDAINRVNRITFFAELATYPAGSSLSRVVVEGQHVFVMDRGSGIVYHHQLDGFQQALDPTTLTTTVVRKGQQVGSVLVGNLVDMAWMPVGLGRQKADLVILESDRSLLEYDPATKELVPKAVAASETWRFPRLVGGYSGRFYLLDPTANKIWRYEPDQAGYSSNPYDWLQTSVDLAGVVDMAIGHSIYLLFKDGAIRKLSAGEVEAFDVSDWDSPPLGPTAIFTRPPEQVESVYVADPGYSRIVQCSKEGRFERQFRLSEADTAGGTDPLAGVTSLFVDELGGRAFFVSGQALYMFTLSD